MKHKVGVPLSVEEKFEIVCFMYDGRVLTLDSERLHDDDMGTMLFDSSIHIILSLCGLGSILSLYEDFVSAHDERLTLLDI